MGGDKRGLRGSMGMVAEVTLLLIPPLPPEEDRKERRRKLGLPEELTEEEWTLIGHRLRNFKMRRNGVPWTQLFGDPNPAEPDHWIQTRAAARDEKTGLPLIDERRSFFTASTVALATSSGVESTWTVRRSSTATCCRWGARPSTNADNRLYRFCLLNTFLSCAVNKRRAVSTR